jgi:hypothetical protein
MRRLSKTTEARLTLLEQQIPSEPPPRFHLARCKIDTLKEFLKKVRALPEGVPLEDADLSPECWADLAANLTTPEDSYNPNEERPPESREERRARQQRSYAEHVANRAEASL